MIRHVTLQAGYQWAGCNQFADRHRVDPNGRTAVVSDRGRKKAHPFPKAAGVFAVPGGLIEKVRE
jgi:hypothetical protein